MRACSDARSHTFSMETKESKMPKQLFAVREYPYGPMLKNAEGKVICFDDKPSAKLLRNNSKSKFPKAVVTVGPDHNQYIAGDM